MKPKIAMFHALARSGGTLVSRCMGCISGNIVLSEVHHRWAFANPLTQANQWFGLIADSELESLKQSGKTTYVDAIRLINERCRRKGKNLIIRDWTHIDFTPGYTYPVPPVYYLSQYALLYKYFDIRHIAITRDPVDTYLSVSRVDLLRDWLVLPTYLFGYRRFAEIAASIGYMRYEDFCHDPLASMSRVCNTLDIAFDENFLEQFEDYTKVTGELHNTDRPHTMTGDPVGERIKRNTISMPVRRPDYISLLDQLKDSEDYHAIIRILGYTPAWETR